MKSKDNIKTKISIIHLLLSHCLLKEKVKVKVKPDCKQLHEANIGSQLCSSAILSFQFSFSFSLLKQVLNLLVLLFLAKVVDKRLQLAISPLF